MVDDREPQGRPAEESRPTGPPRAVVQAASRFSFVWLIPIVAVAIGAWLGWKALPLVILLSMKMENTIAAAEDGTVAEVLVSEGDNIDAGTVLLRLETDDV